MTTNKFTNVVQNLNQGISRQDAALRFPPSGRCKEHNLRYSVGRSETSRIIYQSASSPVSPDFKFKMHKIERDDDSYMW